MVLDANKFCPWCELWRFVYLDAALFIFKHFAFDIGQGKVKVENDTKLPQ